MNRHSVGGIPFVTHSVKRGCARTCGVYKLILALICAPLLMGGACEKKSAKASDTGAITAMDRKSRS